MKEDLDKRKEFMKDLQRKLNRAENELSQNNMLQDMQATRFYDENQESQVGILPFDWVFNITDWYIAI